MDDELGMGDMLAFELSEDDRLIKRADRALYRAKREGRNRVCLWEPSDDLCDASDAAGGAEGLSCTT